MFDKYIGIPFEKMNCWEFVKYFYKDFLNVEIPSYEIDPTDTPKVSKTMITEINTPKWEILDHCEQYSIVLMKLNSHFINHAGIYLGNNKILHSYSTSNSCIVTAKNNLWAKSIAYFIKPSQL